MHTRHRLVGLGLALAIATPVARTAHAASVDLCLPNAKPAPDWWTPMLTAAKRERRWDGAQVRTFDDGTVHGRVRSVWSDATEQAYFEVQVTGDPSIDPEGDAVLFTLSDATGTEPELFVRFDALLGCADTSDCDGHGAPLDTDAVIFSEASTGGVSWSWSPLSTTNPSADFVVEHPWIVVDDAGPELVWTLSFVLSMPVAANGQLLARRLFTDVLAWDPGIVSGTLHELPLTCTSTSMISNDCLVFGGGQSEAPADLPIFIIDDAWASVDAGTCDGV